MKPTLKNCLALGAIALATQLSGGIALGQASTDLLLSEARIVAPGDDTINTTEFIEIFNPTNTAISLDNYFITDRQDYFNLAKHFYDCEQDPLCTDPGLFATSGPTDYVFRFPTGHSIPSGGVVVVTTDIDNFVTVHFGAEATIDDYYDQPGNPQLFTTRTDVVYTQPDDVTPVPAMIRYGASERLSLTNGGEWTALVYVDGTSELVQDVDIVAWRSPSAGNTFPIKGLLTVGDSTYVEEFGDGDTGGNGNLLVRGDSYHVIARTTTIEVGQAGTTGNGRTGQDETMEDSMTTWVGFVDGNQSTPGVTTLTVGETALPPQIADATRNIEFPTSSDTITISATITDTAGTVAAANVLLDTGSGYTSIAMNNTTGNTWAAEVGPFDDKTAIRWYIDATNNFGVSQTEPFSAPANGFMFHVQNTPVGKGIVVMNEIAYNPTGPDGGGAEFVELYNNTSEEIDLSGFNFSRGSDNNNFTFPWGTTIAANGYLVLVQNIGGMEALYGEGTVSPMLQWGSWQLLNGGVELRLKHANVMGFSDTPFTAVDYSNTEPWPIITFNPDGSGDGNGRTIELIEPNLDESDPLNWRASLGPIGSPGAVNGTATDVSDWVLFH